MHKNRPFPGGLRSLLTLAGAAATTGLSAQTAAAPAAAPAAPASDEDVVVLSPFEVTADSSNGYVATQTLAGSRINTRLEDVGSAISVVTAEFLKDTGATDNKTLLAYTTNTEVGGTQGNFRGSTGGQYEDENSKFTNPNQNTRVRGLSAADNTRNFFGSAIPWDGYNVDRVDMQRGPNSILFGLGSPAGIINTTTKVAQHRTFGSIEARYGSYGANRQALDFNQNILADELSVRIATVRNDEKYKQDPAYSLDRRFFGTLRYDPQFLSKNGHKTSLKVNYETGSIRSNNPRTITPTDRITAWWDQLGQRGYDIARVQSRGPFYNPDQTTYYPTDIGEINSSLANGVTTQYQPWIENPGFFGGVWMSSGSDGVPSGISMPEFRTLNGIGTSGAIDGSIGGLPYSRRVAIVGTSMWASRANAKFAGYGVWKNRTLSDASVFDFYNKLIDGDNKREWQNFHDFSATLTQTFFKDTLGFEAAYDHQRYRQGQLSYSDGALYVDINKTNLDGSANSNFGRAYIESSNAYGAGVSDTTLESARLNAFFNHDFNKGGNKGWFWKLLGRHTISGLYSQDMIRTDNRSGMRYGTPDSYAAMSTTALTGTNEATKINGNDRIVATTVYLSDSLAGFSSYKEGLPINGAGAEIAVPGTAEVRYFDSTWTATGVSPSAAWVNTFSGQNSTQSENPANYVGWKTTTVDIQSWADGDQDTLTTSATLSRRKTDSRAAVLQSYFWDGAIVGMWGIRTDNVKGWTYTAPSQKLGSVITNRSNLTALHDSTSPYAGLPVYQTTNKEATGLPGSGTSRYEANSPSWSIVGKLNKFFGKYGERFPINIALYYNESQNFQILPPRNDIYGQPLPNPTGKTNDRGIMVSTKDERFSLRINKYQTDLKNASAANTLDSALWFFTGSGNFIQRNEDRYDAYTQHLLVLGDPTSVDTGTGLPGVAAGKWQWRYLPGGNAADQAAADALQKAACDAWRAYTNEPVVQRILKAWGFNDFNVTQSTTMSTPVSNFRATEDQHSEGWEYEFTANPTKNWRITVNASETKAMRNNIGGEALQEFVELTNKYQNGPMGEMRQWGGGQNTLPPPGLNSWNGNFYSKYALLKLQEGTYSQELRRWRLNLITNYNFTDGRLKGFNVGGGYRWQDKIAIGYPCAEVSSGTLKYLTFDIEHPYMGPAESYIDLWLGYERKLTSKVNWRVQLNVRNVGKGNKLVPLSAEFDGSIAAWGIAPSQTWTLTNTFSF
jgi:outer membrane receptor protein involved in Fe transport